MLVPCLTVFEQMIYLGRYRTGTRFTKDNYTIAVENLLCTVRQFLNNFFLKARTKTCRRGKTIVPSKIETKLIANLFVYRCAIRPGFGLLFCYMSNLRPSG